MKLFSGMFLTLFALSSIGCSQHLELLQDLQTNIASGGEAYSDKSLGTAKMEDEALEKSMAQALKNAKWKEDVLGITITSANWRLKRHAVSGAILYRTIGTNVVVKHADRDHCRLFSLSFKQEHDGAEYGETALNGVGGSVKVYCDKALATDNK